VWERKIRTELGNEITSEETRAAKDGRDVPRYCTTPRRAIRDDWRVIRQCVYSTLELQKKMWQSLALANTEGWVLKTYPSSRCDHTRQPRNCRRREEHGQGEQSSSRQSPSSDLLDRMSP
jgi:hypothetical protein